LIGLKTSIFSTDSENVVELLLNRIQLDNTAEPEPLFPVVLKPNCSVGEKAHNHEKMEGVEPVF
jgi:hypothetical protein